MSNAKPSPEKLALLQNTLNRSGPWVRGSTNLNETGDFQDLYFVIDYLGYATDQAYPDTPCHKGCSHCCADTIFRVTRREWERVKLALAQWPAERLKALHEDVEARFGPQEAQLRAVSRQWTEGPDAGKEAFDQARGRCPLLGSDGRCTIYEERPGICRAFGYYAATVDHKPCVLICKQEGGAWLELMGGKVEGEGMVQFPMPNWGPVQDRLHQLSPGEPVKPLVLWLLEGFRSKEIDKE